MKSSNLRANNSKVITFATESRNWETVNYNSWHNYDGDESGCGGYVELGEIRAFDGAFSRTVTDK
jgi:hypothetical protein